MGSRRKRYSARRPGRRREARTQRPRQEGARSRSARGKLHFGVHLLSVAVLVALGLFAHRGTLGYAMFGIDSYPQIIASRVQSFSDLVDTFRETLTDGLITGQFFRPTQNLSLALDYAIGGLEPSGYHLTSWLAYGVCIALLYLATRRLLGPRAWLGPVVAAGFLALHPALMDVVPVPAHRPELLVVVFLLSALLVAPVGERKRVGLRAVAAGILVWLASGAKEIGVIGFGLVLLQQFLFTRSENVIRRVSSAGLVAIPAALGAAIYMANRIAVLGGVGGYLDDPLTSYPTLLYKAWSQLVVAGLCPWWFVNGWTPAVLASVSAMIVVLLITLFFLINVTSEDRARRDVAKLLVVGLAWLLPAIGILGLSDKYRVWYALVPVAGLAFILAGLAQGVVLLIRERGAQRTIGCVSAAGLTVVVFLALYASPLYTDYTQWREATPMLNAVLRDLGEKIEHSKPEDRIHHAVVHRYSGPFPQDRPYVARVPMFLTFSVQAWADLKYPEKNTRVVMGKPLSEFDGVQLLLKFARQYPPTPDDATGATGTPIRAPDSRPHE